MTKEQPKYFHLHMISDATGETLATIAKAAIVQYGQIRAIEHIYSAVRTPEKLKRVLQEVETTPGIVLYTIISRELADSLEAACETMNVPCIPVLKPLMQILESYLGAPQTPTVGGQHVLDSNYFRRIDALNYTMAHDDGQLPEDLDKADIVLVGISRTSKTPTSIYLANRGLKTANVPIVANSPVTPYLENLKNAFVVGLVASPDRIEAVRRKRVQVFGDRELKDYVDVESISQELAMARRLLASHGWPMIDVTRRSIEETAAAVLDLYHRRKAKVE